MQPLPMGAGTAIGSLPHTDPVAASRFALQASDIPAIPVLPRLHAAEGRLGRATAGVANVALLSADRVLVTGALDPDAPVVTDLYDPAFTAFRTFLDEAAFEAHVGPVKWQLTGPITLGVALIEAGARAEVAFAVAAAAVRERALALHRAVATTLPDATQVVFFDEPALGSLEQPGFPIGSEAAVDLLSGALATLEAKAHVGVHCCGMADWALVLEAGPAVLSVPVDPALVHYSGHLARHLDHGGLIAWGAVPTDRPFGLSPDRPWKQLTGLWCEITRGACDPALLRRQSLVTPVCGLAGHGESQADKTMKLVERVAAMVRQQAVATKLSVGA